MVGGLRLSNESVDDDGCTDGARRLEETVDANDDSGVDDGNRRRDGTILLPDGKEGDKMAPDDVDNVVVDEDGARVRPTRSLTASGGGGGRDG